VAASVSEVSTPSAPLTRMFHAPSSPGSESASPIHSTVGGGPVNGNSTASTTKGASINDRAAIQRIGMPAATHTATSTSR